MEVALPTKPSAVQWDTEVGVFTVPVSETSETIYVIEAATGNILMTAFKGDEAALATIVEKTTTENETGSSGAR